MNLYDLYVRFMVWLGAEPPLGYEYLLPQKVTPKSSSVPDKELPPPPRMTPVKPRPSPPLFRDRSPTIYTGEAKRLYQDLLAKVLNNHEVVERLIDYERKRSPQANEEQLLQNAIDHWEHDNG